MASKLKSFKIFTTSASPLRVILLIRLLFGSYINVSKSKLVRCLIRLYCICICLVISTLYIFSHFGHNISHSHHFVYMEYICNFIIYFIFADEHFFKYCSAIKISDKIIGFKNISLFTNYMYLIIFVAILTRLSIAIIRTTFDVSIVESYSNNFVLFSLDLNHITIIIIFSILHSRVKLLRKFLERNVIPVYITRKNEVMINIKRVRKSLYNYNNLLDHMEFIDTQMQYLVILDLS